MSPTIAVREIANKITETTTPAPIDTATNCPLVTAAPACDSQIWPRLRTLVGLAPRK
jgi:hypothetical protein